MSTLKVPGAQLFYEVSGSGPLLILIPGASGTGESFRPLAPHLISRYQVVTYDRRGFSRSQLDGPTNPAHRLATDADDVLRLIEHLTDQSVMVFGSSSGAIVALEVLTHAPEWVQTLVAHEPPAVKLLSDAASWLAFFDGVYETYRPAVAALAANPQRHRLYEAKATLDAIVDELIAGRRNRPMESENDLLTMLLQVLDEEAGLGMSDQQVRNEVMTLMAAGHEITSNALCWTFMLLAQHPDIEARLREEYTRVLGGRAVQIQEMSFVPGGVVHFPKETCAGCPLKEQCTTSVKGRSVSIHPNEALLIELRERQQTTQGRAQLRERAAVEHTLAHVGRWQGRRARYRGLRKNLFDLRRCAVVHNLHVLARSQVLPTELQTAA